MFQDSQGSTDKFCLEGRGRKERDLFSFVRSVSVSPVCVLELPALDPVELELLGSCEPLNGCWNLSPDPPEEKQ